MDKEHRQLLQSSVDSVKGLAKAFKKNSDETEETTGAINVSRVKSSKHADKSIGVLQGIRDILAKQFNFQKARDKESEFEADSAKKGTKWSLLKTKVKESSDEVKDVRDQFKKGGWFKKLLIILAAILGFGTGLIIGLFQGIWNTFKFLGRLFKLNKIFGPIIKSVKAFFGTIGRFFVRIFGKNSAIGRLFGRIRTFLRPIIAGVRGFFGRITGFFSRIFGKNSAIGKIFGFIGKIFKPLAGVSRTVGKVGGFFRLLSKVFGNLSKVFGTFFKIGKFIGKFLGPIGLVLTIVMGVIDFFKGFKATEGGFFEKLMGGLGGLFAGILGMPLDLLKNAIAWLFEKFGWTKLAAKMKEFSFSDIIKDFFAFIPKLIGIIKDFFVNNPIGKVLGLAIKIIFWPITLVINAVKGIINFIKGFFRGFKETEGGFFEKLLGGLLGGLKEVWEGIKNFFSGIWDTIKSIPETIGNIIKGEFFQNILGGLKNIWEKIKGFFSGLVPQFIKDWFDKSDEKSEESGGFLQGIINIFEKIGTFISGLIPQGIKDFFTSRWENIKTNSSAFLEVIVNIFGKIGTFLSGLIPQFIKNWFDKSDEKSEESGGFLQGIVDVFTKITSWISNLIPQPIKDFFNSLPSASDIVGGIKDSIEKLIAWFGELKDKFLDLFRGSKEQAEAKDQAKESGRTLEEAKERGASPEEIRNLESAAALDEANFLRVRAQNHLDAAINRKDKWWAVGKGQGAFANYQADMALMNEALLRAGQSPEPIASSFAQGGILPAGVALPAMLHGPEAVIPLPNLPSAQLSALSGQLALQAAAAGGGGGGTPQSGGNITTANSITNNNT